MINQISYNNLKDKLRKSGLKVTSKRLAILKVFANSPKEHLNVEEIHQKAKGYEANISLATVYRTIRYLKINKVIDGHDFNKDKTFYEAIGHNKHDHLIDLEDYSVKEFFDKEIVNLVKRVAKKFNYEISDYKLELYGKKNKK